MFPVKLSSFILSSCLQTLRQTLESGKPLAFPDGLLINGQAHSTFTGNPGKPVFFKGYSSNMHKV